MVVLFVLTTLLVVASANLHVHEEPLLHRSSLASRVEDELNYRLPTNIKPVSYNIKLTPHLVEDDFSFDGEIIIEFIVLQVTNQIVLHAKNLTIDESSITLLKQGFPPSPGKLHSSTAVDSIMQFYTITYDDLLEPSASYLLSIHFVGYLDDDMQGFYRSSYMSGGERRWLATTQLQATEARRAFPCFDEPALKAKVTINICREPHLHSISNMPLKSTTTEGGLECDHFEESPLMSTYLVAFIVSDFEYLYNSKENFRIFAQPPMIEQAMYSFSVSPPILKWLEDFTNINYTLPKMDEVAVPDFDAGAMENWGICTYRERLLLFQEGVSTSEDKQRIATVIAHEYAHQWFGDLVSPHWWKDSWLNEGFATYFESFATAKVETTWRLEEQFVVRDLQSSMGADARETSHPISHDVCSPASISALFNTIIYEKAGSVIRMMKHIVSEGTFQRGLNKYLTARSFDVAMPEHLFRAIDDQYLMDNNGASGLLYLPKIMNTWIEQMGYPVVTVTRAYGTFRATIKQERFLLKRSENSTDTHDYKWHIPLTYTTQEAMDFESTTPTLWLEADNNSITVDRLPGIDAWILFNIQETGYYRVNYDMRNWELLSKHLDSPALETIHLVNRAQLIDDSFNLARAGIIDYFTALELSRYLAREVDYVPWYSAFRALLFIDIKLNQRGEDYMAVQEYITGLITKVYEEVGLEDAPNDGHVTRLNRAAAVSWACRMEVPSCTNTSSVHLKSWMTTGENNIKPDVKSAMYCTALRHGNESEWSFLRQQYEVNTIASESTLLISALGCTTDKVILELYLNDSISPGSTIRRQDARAVYTSVYSNPIGVDIALDFLINQWEVVSNFYGGLNSIGSLLTGIASRLNTQTQVDKLKAFFVANDDELQLVAAAAMQNAIDIMDETMAWQGRYSDQIIAWVKNELANQATTTTEASTSTTSQPTTPGTPTTTPGAASTSYISAILVAVVMSVYMMI